MSLGCCDLQDGNNPGRIRSPNSNATKLALMPHAFSHWVNGCVGWDHYCMKHKKTTPKALRAKCHGKKGRPEQQMHGQDEI